MDNEARGGKSVGESRPANHRLPLAWPAALLVVFSILTWLTDSDLQVASWFFDGRSLTDTQFNPWPHSQVTPWYEIYHAGVYPALALALWAIGRIVLGWFVAKPYHDRPGWFLLAALVIGPGLIVNVGLKDHFGRPRPYEVVEFGGTRPFLRLGVAEWGGPHNSSFPSGHAAAAFFVMTPGLAYWLTNRRRASIWLVVGLIWGSVMGMTRLVQGGHFLSDVVWSAGLVYLVGALLSRMIFVAPALPVVAGEVSGDKRDAGQPPSRFAA